MSNVKVKIYYDKSKDKIIAAGEHNKEKIFKYITEHPGGLYPYEIARALKLVRQTVHNHLLELLKEKRIYKGKKNRKYFAQDPGLNSITLFANVMKDSSWRLIDADLIEPSKKLVDFIYSSRSQSTAYGELLKKVHGISVSSNFCETKFATKENFNEKCLFEFANRIGAFIAYVFIESMRPLEKNIAPRMPHHNKRRILASSDLIYTAINIDDIFRRFCLLFKQTGLLNIMDPRHHNDESAFFELEENEVDKMSEIFKRVYPGLYEGLENFWLTSRHAWLKMYTSFARKENCDHKWEETFIYKYKLPCYLCRKCHLLADSPIISEIKEKKRKVVWIIMHHKKHADD